MNRFTHNLIKVSAIAALAVGSYTLPALALAAPPKEATAASPAELVVQADRAAKIAADYRARMRTDEKRAILYFTLANSWDHKAKRLRMAAGETGATPRL